MILHEFIDYDTLKLIWWVLLGVLLIGFAVTDGFDMGVGALLPFAARTDMERRIAINTIAPIWEGNQVWFILGGGAIFAAWPPLYAVSFSGFYIAMFLILAALILRPVGFKYRSKREDPRWRSTWDWALSPEGLRTMPSSRPPPCVTSHSPHPTCTMAASRRWRKWWSSTAAGCSTVPAWTPS